MNHGITNAYKVMDRIEMLLWDRNGMFYESFEIIALSFQLETIGDVDILVIWPGLSLCTMMKRHAKHLRQGSLGLTGLYLLPPPRTPEPWRSKGKERRRVLPRNGLRMTDLRRGRRAVRPSSAEQARKSFSVERDGRPPRQRRDGKSRRYYQIVYDGQCA